MIESIEDIDIKTKKYKCKCDKTGVLYERVKKPDHDGRSMRPSNTEAALCDEEIVKFKKFLKDKGYGGDCWCGHIAKYVGGM